MTSWSSPLDWVYTDTTGENMTKKPSEAAQHIINLLTLLSSRLDTMSAAMDDMSAAVDEMSGRLTQVEDRLSTIVDWGLDTRDNVRDIFAHTSGLADDLATLAKSVETTDAALYDVHELAEEARRRERQEQLFDARAAMGRVAFVRMKA